MNRSRLAPLAVLLACCGPLPLLAEDPPAPQPAPKDAPAAQPPQKNAPAAQPAPKDPPTQPPQKDAPAAQPAHVDLHAELPPETPPATFSVSGEYLLWSVTSARLPIPLVTTGPAVDPNAGGLADVNTLVVFGNDKLQFGPASGFRGEAALSLNELGLTLTFGGFRLQGQGTHDTFGSDANGNPILFRPFFNVENNNPNGGFIVSLPGAARGSIDIHTRSQIYGLESNGVWGLACADNWSLSGVVGGRYLRLTDSLNILTNSTVLAPGLAVFNRVPLNPGDQVLVLDSFSTRSQFFGAQAGLFLEAKIWQLWFGLGGKLGVGVTHSDQLVFGVSRGISPGNGLDLTLPGGALALPSNSGRFSRDNLTFVPEFNFNLGYDIFSRLRLTIGYDLLYWSRVARAAEQIPTRVSPTQIPASPQFGTPGMNNIPGPTFPLSDLLLQGLHCGLEYRF